MKKLFIGIDFSKEKFDATIILACGMNEIGNREYGSFANDKKGYRQFLKWVKTHSWECLTEEWLFCGEDTGSCSIGLSRRLYGKGCDIWIEDAYTIKHSSGIQRVKNDKADSAFIAEYAWRHQDKAVVFEPMSESLTQLREVFLYRHKLVQQKVAMEIRKGGKEAYGKSRAMSFINRKSKHLIAEIEKAVAECDKMIDAIIEADEELKENYAIITSVKGVARTECGLYDDLHQQLQEIRGESTEDCLLLWCGSVREAVWNKCEHSGTYKPFCQQADQGTTGTGGALCQDI